MVPMMQRWQECAVPGRARIEPNTWQAIKAMANPGKKKAIAVSQPHHSLARLRAAW
jgi:hypothetical protein